MHCFIYLFLILVGFPIYAKDASLGIPISQEIVNQIQNETNKEKGSILFLGMSIYDNSPNHFFGENYLDGETCYDVIIAINQPLDLIKKFESSLIPGGKLILFYFPLESKHWRFLESVFGKESTSDVSKLKLYRNSLKKMGLSIKKSISVPKVAFYRSKEEMVNEFISFPSLWKAEASQENIHTFADYIPENELILIRYRYLLSILQKRKVS